MTGKLKIAAAAALLACAGSISAQVQTIDQNPAMNHPDQGAWQLFVQVAAPSASGQATFETWASDADTFNPNPSFPGGKTSLALKPRALTSNGIPLVPGAGTTSPTEADDTLEEVRRNRPAFDYIVGNKLYSVTGLKAAYGKTISFPADAIEVKANWLPVAKVPAFTNGKVTLKDVPKYYHIAYDGKGNPWAMVAMHITTKQVPNWTWATWEHRFNPERCDTIGCADSFGSTTPVFQPNAKDDQGYGACAPTAALQALFAGVPDLDPAFTNGNYCLRGTMTDFTDPSGLPRQLGNSIIEHGFVGQSSCISCHGSAGFNQQGQPTFQGTPLGAIQPSWYWSFTAGPVIGASGVPALTTIAPSRISTPADFVWSIPFCAYDDTGPTPKPSACASE